MSERRIRLGLVGLGKQGREYLQAAAQAPGVLIAAGHDADATVRDRIASEFPHLEMVADIGDLGWLGLDGLLLALPHHIYAGVWDNLLALGLPLLKEKPLGRSIAEARRFVTSARRAGVPVQTAIQRRHHPTYRELARRLESVAIFEIDAHLHLGFDPRESPRAWRGRRDTSGGGALLDSGYHLIDLVHFLIGRFEVVSSGLWAGSGRLIRADDGDDDAPNGPPESIETEARLFGRQGSTWIAIESLVGGRPDENGRPRKSEGIEVACSVGRFHADRESLILDGETILRCDRGWTRAMAEQIEGFAARLRHQNWSAAQIWDQLPVMRLIERAYSEVFTAL